MFSASACAATDMGTGASQVAAKHVVIDCTYTVMEGLRSSLGVHCFSSLGNHVLPRPIVHNPETHSRSHVFRSSMGVFYFSPATPMWCRVSPTTVVPICQDHCPFRVVKTNWVWTFCLVPQSLPSMYSRILGKAFFLNRTSETTGQGHFFSW